MYAIDFTTCSARDVILRSVTCHPSMLRDALASVRKTHRDYATLAYDNGRKEASVAASSMAKALTKAIKLVEGCDTAERITDEICQDCSMYVQVFTQAAKLQCVTHGVQADIMARSPFG